MSDNFTTYCKCGCGNGMNITFCFDDDDYYVVIDTVTNGFMSKQCGIFAIIRRRVKAAWLMLRGKEFVLHDIALDKKEWNEFVNVVNNIGKEENNG